MLFKEKQKLTIICVSEFLATTIKREITITRTINNRVAYSVRGKRKEYYFTAKPDTLVFDGWGLPLMLDTETSRFEGNGCYNFITPDFNALKQYILTKNINKAFNCYEAIYAEPTIRNGSVAMFTKTELKNLYHGN